MFREKYLISQRGLPSGEMFQGAAKPASLKPEAQKPLKIDSKATDAVRREAAEKAAEGRRKMMETVVPKIANAILEKIFGHNADLVKHELGPKYEQIIENIGGSLKKPGDKYLRSALIDDRVHIIFQLDGHEIDMDLAAVLLLSDEEVKSLRPLITLKREKRAPEAKPETVWTKAEKVIQEEIMDIIFALKPDDVPDTLEVEEILATPMIKEIRAKLVKSYKAGKPYEVTTTDQGFKLESQDPKNFPEQEFNIEEFWDKFAATARLDAEWYGRRAEDMNLEEIKLLLLGDEKRGIQGRSIGEIQAQYGPIPGDHIYNLKELERKEHFSDIRTEIDSLWDFQTQFRDGMPEQDRTYVLDTAQKSLRILDQKCPKLKIGEFMTKYKNVTDRKDMRKLAVNTYSQIWSSVDFGTIKESAAASLFLGYLTLMERVYNDQFDHSIPILTK